MRIFVQNQGMREILLQAYSQYSEDKILSITPKLGKKTILQEAHRRRAKISCPAQGYDTGFRHRQRFLIQ